MIQQTPPAPGNYAAGTLHSPQYLGTEAEYFKEAHRLIDSAHAGDRLELQMYEFENAQTSPERPGATLAAAYADQQALLGALKRAAGRGARVNVLLDGSKDKKTHQLMDGPVFNDLKAFSEENSNLQVQLYPPRWVNIDHAKELVKTSQGPDGVEQVEEALTGGSNWGNHTPANDDGGAAFYGRDAVGGAEVFSRDWAYAEGDKESPAIAEPDAHACVQWYASSPKDEGGGSHGIQQIKLEQTRNAGSVYVNQFCLTSKPLLEELQNKGANAHVRLDPNEFFVNRGAIDTLRASGAQAQWAATQLDPTMPDQKNHEKIDIYCNDQGRATGMTVGSANDTASGLAGNDAEQKRKANHELDVFVRRSDDSDPVEMTPEGEYSTAPFLDAALAKTQNDLAHRSLRYAPHKTSSTAPGNF